MPEDERDIVAGFLKFIIYTLIIPVDARVVDYPRTKFGPEFVNLKQTIKSVSLYEGNKELRNN